MWNTSSKNPINASWPVKVILLFGPTGVGKTEVLTRLFSRGCEVISADAFQVYRGLDIGTAKPSAGERTLLPHHLIDIKEPDEQFTVGEFVRLADEKTREIASRGRTPVLSGGTAYYFKHYLFGLPSAPPSSQAVRKQLRQEMRTQGSEALYRRLKEVDPQAAGSISPQDSYRIQRALEVYETSGKPLSSFSVPETVRAHLDPVIIGLYRDQQELHARIERRADQMMSTGLYGEVRKLMRSGAKANWPAMKGIGYREFFLFQDSGEYSLHSAARLIAGNTKKYAKQQMTFFRSLPDVQWVRPEEDHLISTLALRQ